MISLSEHQFFSLIIDVFDTVIRKYGLEIHEESKNLVVATKGSIELIFRLEPTYLAYYFSLEIRLVGELGERATSNSLYRHLGVAAIARCLDPNYDRPVKEIQTEQNLREIAEGHREELLKYCENILLGDVSSWQTVVNCLEKKSLERGKLV